MRNKKDHVIILASVSQSQRAFFPADILTRHSRKSSGVTKTWTAKWNSATIHVIIYTCAFSLTVTGQNVCCEGSKLYSVTTFFDRTRYHVVMMIKVSLNTISWHVISWKTERESNTSKPTRQYETDIKLIPLKDSTFILCLTPDKVQTVFKLWIV